MERKNERESEVWEWPEMRAVHETTLGDGMRRKTAAAEERWLEFE